MGKPVTVSAEIEVPPNAGKLVAAQWDFEGTGDYPIVGKLSTTDPSGSRATVQATYTYAKPGTYFPTLRVASQREGDANTPYARIQNLARVRVVVQ